MSGVQEILQALKFRASPGATSPVIKVNGKLQQPNLGRMAKACTDPSGIKVWVNTPGKEPRPAEAIAKGGGNTEWAVKEGSYKQQVRLQLQK